jgi:hypothetical protein
VRYRLTIDKKPAYLHATVTGRNSSENVVGYLKDILKECVARNCFRVLIEERLDGRRLGTMDVFDIAWGGEDRLCKMLKALAVVDVNRSGDLMQFAETVAHSRGLNVAMFSTVAEAEKWLLDQARKAAELLRNNEVGSTRPEDRPLRDPSNP